MEETEAKRVRQLSKATEGLAASLGLFRSQTHGLSTEPCGCSWPGESVHLDWSPHSTSNVLCVPSKGPPSSGPNFLTLKCGLIFDNLWGPLGLDALSSQGPGEGQLGWLGWESEVWHKARRREAGGERVSRGGEYWAVSVRPCCLGLTTITPLPTEYILSGHRKALSYSHWVPSKKNRGG